ncbi:MAG TPA: Sua5 YciO YrdC YwlC family protein [Aliarcobacter thereius]|nr:Sua5 YciO YrdC YwlC family protein [Aliarcobacter thereius]HJE03589.1 Sua5 YciO YrdC YwlC family protein [Aliarcobacter thereius]
MNPNLIYLVQTDTTVGFSSINDEKLSNIKKRDINQKILKTVDSFTTLKEFTRVPKNFKRLVRLSIKTTFIYPNLNSFRVISKDSSFHSFIKKFKILSSTSANKTKNSYEYDFAIDNSDIEVVEKNGLFETSSSKIYRLYKKRLRRMR